MPSDKKRRLEIISLIDRTRKAEREAVALRCCGNCHFIHTWCQTVSGASICTKWQRKKK